MRCDVNISVRPRGQERFGTKVEIKNMNSFSAISKAIDYEIERQVGLIVGGRGEEIVTETRLWDENKSVSRGFMREGLVWNREETDIEDPLYIIWLLLPYDIHARSLFLIIMHTNLLSTPSPSPIAPSPR